MNAVLLLCYKVAHTILTICGVRDNLTDWDKFRHLHPLSLLASCLLACFAPQILASVIFGESFLPQLGNIDVLLTIGVWYAIFYAPGDVFHKTVSNKALKFPLAGLKESFRAYKVCAGVEHAEHIVHGVAVAPVLLAGICKGAGTELLRPVEQTIRGEWKPDTFELTNPSYYFKISCIAACVFYTNSSSTTLVAMSGIMAAMKLALLYKEEWAHSHQAEGQDDKGHGHGHEAHHHHHINPFEAVENVICSVLFGSGEQKSAAVEEKKKE